MLSDENSRVRAIRKEFYACVAPFVEDRDCELKRCVCACVCVCGCMCVCVCVFTRTIYLVTTACVTMCVAMRATFCVGLYVCCCWSARLSARASLTTAPQARADGLCSIREELMAQAMDEMIRQVTLLSPERGVLLMRLRDEARMTLAAYETMYLGRCARGSLLCFAFIYVYI